MRRLAFFISLCLLMLYFFAGATARKKSLEVPLVVHNDTTALQAKHFNASQIHRYLQDPAFRYNKNDIEGESLWDRFWHWFWDVLNRHLFWSPESTIFWKYFFIVLGGIFLLFIILRMSGINTMLIVTGKSKAIDVPYNEVLENIHELNFEKEIEKALAGGNYRFAVRYLYLLSLKQLSDAGIINWQIEKTNASYLLEVPQGEKRQLFKQLTLQFEYVWYGNFDIDSRGFNAINAQFKQFKQILG